MLPQGPSTRCIANTTNSIVMRGSSELLCRLLHGSPPIMLHPLQMVTPSRCSLARLSALSHGSRNVICTLLPPQMALQHVMVWNIIFSAVTERITEQGPASAVGRKDKICGSCQIGQHNACPRYPTFNTFAVDQKGTPD